MGKMKDALVKLARKATGKVVPDTNSISNVVEYMADNYGGGTGGVSGPVLLPRTIMTGESLGLGYGNYKIDYAKFATKLEELGFDLDANFLKQIEAKYYISIGVRCIDPDELANNYCAILHIEVVYVAANDTFEVRYNKLAGRIVNDPLPEPDLVLEGKDYTTREFLNILNDSDVNVNNSYMVASYAIDDYLIVSNEITISRPVINDVEYNTISNVVTFMKDILTIEGSGSGSSE